MQGGHARPHDAALRLRHAARGFRGGAHLRVRQGARCTWRVRVRVRASARACASVNGGRCMPVPSDCDASAAPLVSLLGGKPPVGHRGLLRFGWKLTCCSTVLWLPYAAGRRKFTSAAALASSNMPSCTATALSSATRLGRPALSLVPHVATDALVIIPLPSAAHALGPGAPPSASAAGVAPSLPPQLVMPCSAAFARGYRLICIEASTLRLLCGCGS